MNDQFRFEAEEFEFDSEFEDAGEFEGEEEDGGYEMESEGFGELGEGEYEFEFADEKGGGGGGGGADVQRKIQQLRNAHATLSRAVGTMGKHVKRKGGAMRLAIRARNAQDAANQLRINPRLFNVLHNSLKRRNAQLRSGGRAGAALEMEASTTPCPGRTEVKPSWWGVQVWLNECHTKALIEALKAGTGAGALCVAVAPPPQVKLVCGVLAALGTVGAAAIAGIDSLGGNRGIVISKLSDPITPPVVWHQ
jgi:hypothetical protein